MLNAPPAKQSNRTTSHSWDSSSAACCIKKVLPTPPAACKTTGGVSRFNMSTNKAICFLYTALDLSITGNREGQGKHSSRSYTPIADNTSSAPMIFLPSAPAIPALSLTKSCNRDRMSLNPLASVADNCCSRLNSKA